MSCNNTQLNKRNVPFNIDEVNQQVKRRNTTSIEEEVKENDPQQTDEIVWEENGVPMYGKFGPPNYGRPDEDVDLRSHNWLQPKKNARIAVGKEFQALIPNCEK